MASGIGAVKPHARVNASISPSACDCGIFQSTVIVTGAVAATPLAVLIEAVALKISGPGVPGASCAIARATVSPINATTLPAHDARRCMQ